MGVMLRTQARDVKSRVPPKFDAKSFPSREPYVPDVKVEFEVTADDRTLTQMENDRKSFTPGSDLLRMTTERTGQSTNFDTPPEMERDASRRDQLGSAQAR